MKNIEKFKEVFGFSPRVDACLSYICDKCPLRKRGHDFACYSKNRVDWWNGEYNNGGEL